MRQILRKLITLVPTILLVSALTFFLTSLLPGDPALLVLARIERAGSRLERVLRPGFPARPWAGFDRFGDAHKRVSGKGFSLCLAGGNALVMS